MQARRFCRRSVFWVSHDGQGRRTRLLRSVYGSAASEAFLIIAIITILVTRLYLWLTGFPQIGNGTLHIAHALWGGAAMMAALLIGWLFLGSGTRLTTIVVGGIGFGLFLDEVGKFVTQDNDYFYGPAAEIMYVLVVALLIINRILRDFRTPTADECLANAAAIAADGLVHGLTTGQRQRATRLLQRVNNSRGDDEPLSAIATLIESASPRHDRLAATADFAARLIPNVFRRPFWVTLIGWILVAVSAFGILTGIIQLVSGGLILNTRNTSLHIDRMSISGAILFVSALITFALAVPSMIRRHWDHSVTPLRALRLAALVFTTLTALVEFATAGFPALLTLAFGLFAMAVFSYQISALDAQSTAPSPVPAQE